MFYGMIRAAAASPALRVADTRGNAEEIIRMMGNLRDKGAKIAVFPELCLTGYTAGDLFFQKTLLDGAKDALLRVADASRGMDMLVVVGVPWTVGNSLYNCAAVVKDGRILGMVPKVCMPNYGEFYDLRQFNSGENLSARDRERDFPISDKLLFQCENAAELTIGIEICEDLWSPLPPSARHAVRGATVILNPSASDEVAGKGEYRRELVASHSGRLAAGYVYANAGPGESTQDMVFGAHSMIAENGSILAENPRFREDAILADLDIDFLAAERRRINTFRAAPDAGYQIIPFRFDRLENEGSPLRRIDPAPFVPGDPEKRAYRCEEILSIQAQGLAKRIRHTHAASLVVGVSGGLDSTLAMVVAARALRICGEPAEKLLAVTMPCFGTTRRTHDNAVKLAEGLGAKLIEINIRDAVSQHFRDIGLPDTARDVTYENSQARERTQVLMDLANKCGGLVIGTGDLSELALGWATYNGDHMSMYAVNASVPKTLIRYLVAYEADRTENELLRDVLTDVLDTPVSPELLPPDEAGAIAQKTEDLVGPYELHDFFLYHLVRRGAKPEKILYLARAAFAGKYPDEVIRGWLSTFVRRFFSQQFKRSCIPDGPKVGTVTLSPRGDWRMPTDAVNDLWKI